MGKRATKNKPEGYVFGRPSLYEDRYVQMMEDYFNVPSNQIYAKGAIETEQAVRMINEGNLEGAKLMLQSRTDSYKVVVIPANFPTLSELANKIGVTRETLWHWAYAKNEDGTPKYPDFFNAYKRAKDHQERILVENGLLGAYKGNFAIFTAKNVLGWRDKQNIEHSGGDKPVEIEQVSDLELAKRLVYLLVKANLTRMKKIGCSMKQEKVST